MATEADDPGANGTGADAELESLQSNGYVVFRGVLGADVCDALRTHVQAMADEGKRLGRNDLFGNIQEQDNRSDLKLDLCDPVVTALNQFVLRCGPTLNSFLGGGNFKLVELAAITSDPGSISQAVHADTMHGVTRFLQSDIDLPVGADPGDISEDEDAPEALGQIVQAVATETALITSALVALQDVDADMGPTHVWPGTNTVEHHATLWNTGTGGKLSISEADDAFKVKHLDMTIKKGDLVLYDSRTMHCGGANTSSDKRRTVMVISTMGSGIRPDGSTYTMLAQLRNRLRFKDFPLPPDAISAPTATLGAVVLPAPPATSVAADKAGYADGDEKPLKAVPPVDEWQAAVQCTLCRQWRPVDTMDAPRFASIDSGFLCANAGFKCTQPQVYTQKEIDDALA